jgi:hypothetical protein
MFLKIYKKYSGFSYYITKTSNIVFSFAIQEDNEFQLVIKSSFKQ